MLPRQECVAQFPRFRPFADKDARKPENGTPFVVAGTGKPLRQFIYSRDLAKLFIWQLRKYDDVEPVILSVGEDEEVSIKDAADALVAAMGLTGEYRFDSTKADGQFRKPASNKKLISLIGEFQFTPFDEGTRSSDLPSLEACIPFLTLCSSRSDGQMVSRAS